jgi:hypothetical protein
MGMATKKRKVRRVLRRYRHRHVYRPLSPAQRRFRIFEHDFHTVLEASVRAGGRSPAAIVRDAELAALAMAEAIDARRPKNSDAMALRFHVRGTRSPWREWQSLFDRMVHSMSERTSLTPSKVVARSAQIADLALDVLRRRRLRKGVA